MSRVYLSLVTVNVQWLFLTVPWVGLKCVIVVYPDHACLLAYGHVITSVLLVCVFKVYVTCIKLGMRNLIYKISWGRATEL